ncbi:malto-oligosyltrehalose synthase [Nocardiopsis kunsanensis]|uniref:malto-oligosyltrehalose synthase n=1 Tax=Nocardiopsis kunsanensis TaxID=141693 RepID=UPI00034B2033|nr:malto-oligosyltrehalose synthase [Nocardiopsis kunsanensis]
MSAHDNRPASAPTSTYRLQLNAGLTLRDAADLLDQLERLGVGTLYLSPILTATPGSQHGYDVVDPTSVAPALGGDEARSALAHKAHERGMGVVVDIVPNHVSVARPDTNPWWWDLLRLGPDSPYARFFDVDLSLPLLIPVLGEDAQEALTLTDGCLAYHDKRYPLAPGTHEHGDDAETVHRRQHYRLVSWRRGDSELTYRRFFDVDELAAVRVEDPTVFEAAHAEILRWAELGELDGLRLDHIDGLSDPGAYLRRLTARFPGWVVVEKILAPGEDLPQSWPVAGTTGYDALREYTGVLVDPTGEADLTALATGEGVPVDVGATDHTARLQAASTLLRTEVRRIAALVAPHAEEAVAELLAAFAVYRTYLPEGLPEWERAVALAGERRPDLATALAALDRHVRQDPGGEAARRIQQTSGMVVAMGTENTAFYRATRFIALNEVGGDPARFALTPEAFHTCAARREARRPHTMTTLSSHDSKRSEDVRARLAVLSELSADFAGAVRRWSATHPLPEPSLDLLGWQTLVGAWPIGEDRLTGYLLKAAREARLGTSWTEPDPAFEQAVRDWAPAVLTDLRQDVAAFADRVRVPGWSNSLTQKALQLLGPGVPDLYQGTELWDLSLVDPDNRRPVDHRTRAEILARLESGWRPAVDSTGAAKLHLVRTCLHTRRELRPRGYTPLHAEGPAARHALAFARTSPGAHGPDLAVVGTRLPLTLESTGGWEETVLPLPPGPWTDRLTGRAVPPDRSDGATAPRLSELLGRYPVAVLVRG